MMNIIDKDHNTERYTIIERAFLDAVKAGLPKTSPDCPICHYDGLGSTTPEIEKTLRGLLLEIGGKDALRTRDWFTRD